MSTNLKHPGPSEDGKKTRTGAAGKSTVPESASLDPADWAAFRAQAHRMLDDMLGEMEHIRRRPVWQPIPEEVRAGFRQPLSAAPTPLDEVHREFLERILPFTARNAHPGFMGWVQGGGTAAGMMAEMLAAGLNANTGGRDQIPLEVERQVVAWMREIFGFPEGASGVLMTGSSMANFAAVAIARDNALGWEVRREGIGPASPKLTAYASAGVHGCVLRAMDLAGLGSDALRLIPMDAEYKIDLAALAEAVEADRAAGLKPFLVVGTAGSVDTGSIDDLAGLAAFCAGQQLWFHVDGALGALGMIVAEIAPRLRGLERADSIAFDFHKWGQVQYDAGCLMVRDGARHRQAFESPAVYLARDERGLAAGSPWPCDFGPELSRGFRALKTWITLKVYGLAALGEVIRHACELARHLESRIAASPELELLAPVALNIVCFRYRAPDAAADELNRQIVIALQEGGVVAPSSTRIGGRLAIRAAIVNHRTAKSNVDALLEEVLKAGRRLSGAGHAETGRNA